ncbi:hypothetical protein K438DRAFT_1788207 [Mycena galopus ATCC 62051]|nr:hypothetical protein K438DRAFT_1788207 [Mycena galopus ATCC 62051]
MKMELYRAKMELHRAKMEMHLFILVYLRNSHLAHLYFWQPLEILIMLGTNFDAVAIKCYEPNNPSVTNPLSHLPPWRFLHEALAGFVLPTVTETATHCLCGHPALSHAQRGPTLPPRGGRAGTGCPKFQTHNFLVDGGHTPCERPGCGVWYISHDEILPTPVQAPPPNVGPFPLPAITQLRVPPSDATVPSRAPTANALLARQARGSQSNVWGNSLSTVGAATLGGDCGRRHHAIHSRKFGPDTGAAAARGPQQPYTLLGSGSQALALGRLAAASAPTPVTVTFTFALWPLPISTPRLNGAEYLEYYPSDVRLLGEAHFVSTLKKFGLIVKFVALTTDTQHSFYAELNTKILEHMAANNLRFSGSIPNPILLPSDVASAEWHNTNFLNFLWTTFAPGNTPPPGTNRKLGLCGVPWQVSPSHIVPISHLAHIGPKYGPIEGHPLGHDFHECFALWVMAALDLDNDPVICLSPYPSTSSAAVDQAGSSLSATSSRLPPLLTAQQSRSIEPCIVGSVASPAWMNSAAIDSDDEDAQIQQAIIASRGLTRSQSATSRPLVHFTFFFASTANMGPYHTLVIAPDADGPCTTSQ